MRSRLKGPSDDRWTVSRGDRWGATKPADLNSVPHSNQVKYVLEATASKKLRPRPLPAATGANQTKLCRVKTSGSCWVCNAFREPRARYFPGRGPRKKLANQDAGGVCRRKYVGWGKCCVSLLQASLLHKQTAQVQLHSSSTISGGCRGAALKYVSSYLSW